MSQEKIRDAALEAVGAHAPPAHATYIGGPTALLDWRGLRLLTDPTFDPAGTTYEPPGYTLRKTQGPALPADRVGAVDAVLLRHDHHFDNLDHAGRALHPSADIQDMSVVKQANPASWIAEDGLREQREAVHELAFRRYHADQWTAAEAYWLPPGAWQQCADDFEIEPGERVFLGVDIGGERAASAIAIVTEDLRAQAEAFQGDRAVLEVVDRVRALAAICDVAELAFDPWRFQQAARELEQDGMRVVEFPQSNARLIPASERLYSAIVEKRLRHRNDPQLNEHVARAVAKDTPRGWRLDKAVARDQIDAIVAVAMAVERAEQQPAPVQLLGWL